PAVNFGGSGSNLLVLQNGFSLTGSVVGSASATNTVELAGSVGSAVTASFNALGLTNFQDVLFGAGGYDTLKVSNASGTLPVVLSGLTLTSDIIDLTGIGSNGSITNNDTVNHRVTLTGSLGSVTLQLDTSDSSNLTTVSD